jgi:hypothetical protein
MDVQHAYTMVTEAQERAKQIMLRNRPSFGRLAEIASALNSFQSNPLMPQLIQEASTCDELIRTGLQQFASIPIADLEALRTMRGDFQRVADAYPFEEMKAAAEATATAARHIRQLLQSIQFSIPRLDPLWTDVSLARRGDAKAAERLTSRFSWHPGQWQKEAIRLRARSLGRTLKEVHQEALVQGVLMALQWEVTDSLPFLIAPNSNWLFDNHHVPTTVCPFDLPLEILWNWIQQEAARAAGLWLVGQSYAPTIVLEEHPGEDGELRLARFTSDSTTNPKMVNQGGRPLGSGTFKDREAFLQEVRLAATEVARRGDRVTQTSVASILCRKSLVGIGDPERQLRSWVSEFRFADWHEVIQLI